MAYLGKIQTSNQFGRDSEANAPIRRALEDATRSNFVGYQADLLVQTRRIEQGKTRLKKQFRYLKMRLAYRQPPATTEDSLILTLSWPTCIGRSAI